MQLAFSDDSGASFGAPMVVDDGPILGRVDLALDAEGAAWLSWVAHRGEDAQILVQRFLPEGALEEPRLVARTSAARASGFPVLQEVRGQVLIAWVEVGAVAEGGAARVAGATPPGASASRIRVLEL